MEPHDHLSGDSILTDFVLFRVRERLPVVLKDHDLFSTESPSHPPPDPTPTLASTPPQRLEPVRKHSWCWWGGGP